VQLSTDLGLHPSHVGLARRLVSAHLIDWKINGETGEVTVLLVSELVTNAMRHGGAPIRLVADTTLSGVRVEVYDGNSDAFPAVRNIRPDAPGGRGLRLVEALADRWGTLEADDGKCVWFEIDGKERVMSTVPGGNGGEAPAEATEADVAEQQTPVDPTADGDGAPARIQAADVEASEGDLAEQAIAVPWDDDEQR
jgi:anti-sigma regulatory factor (Ser/Thr protein kinase)